MKADSPLDLIGLPLAIDSTLKSGDWRASDLDHGQQILEKTWGLLAQKFPPQYKGDAPLIQLSICYSDNQDLQKLNHEWRGRDKPTNILSFPSMWPPIAPLSGQGLAQGAAPPILPLGDLVLAYEIAAKEAADYKIAFADYLAHLLVHGLLHLLGYDHEEDGEAALMESLEIEILSKWNIKNPYLL